MEIRVAPLNDDALPGIRRFLAEDETWDGHDFGQYDLACSLWDGDTVISFVVGEIRSGDGFPGPYAVLRHFPVHPHWYGNIAVLRAQVRAFVDLSRQHGIRQLVAALPLGKPYSQTLFRLARVWRFTPYTARDGFLWFRRTLQEDSHG